MGDEMSGGISKDKIELRSPIKSVTRSDQKLMFDV